jgi:hypothetical protein
MNILIPSQSFHVQATRRKRAKPKNPRKKTKMTKEQRPWKFKTAPKQEKIINARVLLRANDVRGVCR